jgi:hypothetical protein
MGAGRVASFLLGLQAILPLSESLCSSGGLFMALLEAVLASVFSDLTWTG